MFHIPCADSINRRGCIVCRIALMQCRGRFYRVCLRSAELYNIKLHRRYDFFSIFNRQRIFQSELIEHRIRRIIEVTQDAISKMLRFPCKRIALSCLLRR